MELKEDWLMNVKQHQQPNPKNKVRREEEKGMNRKAGFMQS